jgi:hypothetical protein
VSYAVLLIFSCVHVTRAMSSATILNTFQALGSCAILLAFYSFLQSPRLRRAILAWVFHSVEGKPAVVGKG